MGYTLKNILTAQGYTSIKLELGTTQHFILEAKINGIAGRFILDTGASNTCVGTQMDSHFKLRTEASEVKATGAGASDMETHLSLSNLLEIGTAKMQRTPIILFDLTHVNNALQQHDTPLVHGIIGADILLRKKAIIDYAHKRLYLMGKKKKS